MSEGISQGQAQRIAESAASRVRSELSGEIKQVSRRVSTVEGELKKLRNEMGEVADAIHKMGKNLAGKIEDLHTAANQQLNVTRGNAETSRKILNTNTTGFAANVTANEAVRRATKEVNGSVARNTSALVEMEYLRLYNEARAPMRFVDQFVGEIESRFQKAVENVYLNRELYDEHFGRILDESEDKVRSIGEHIFRILEEDFQPTVERRLRIPRSAYQALPLAVDRRRIEERSRQLDADLATLYDDTLEPLLDMHHEFETELAASFAVEAELSDGEVLIPSGVMVDSDGEVDFCIGSKVEGAPDRDDGLHFRLGDDPSYNTLNQALNGEDATLQSKLKPRNFVQMGEEEIEQLMARLEGLSAAGKVDAELLEGYRDYLENFGLRTLASNSDFVMLASSEAPLEASPEAEASRAEPEPQVEEYDTAERDAVPIAESEGEADLPIEEEEDRDVLEGSEDFASQ